MPWGEYVFCELSDGTLGGLPAWMTDSSRVPSFTRGAPLTSAEALAELQSLLERLRPRASIAIWQHGRRVKGMTRMRAGKGAGMEQMNLPLLESKPLMLPSDKQRELTSALADLLLDAAIQSESAAQEGQA